MKGRLFITDINNREIEVTDLAAALRKAEIFKECYDESLPVLSKSLQKYWTHMYNKLKTIKDEFDQQKNAGKA